MPTRLDELIRQADAKANARAGTLGPEQRTPQQREEQRRLETVSPGKFFGGVDPVTSLGSSVKNLLVDPGPRGVMRGDSFEPTIEEPGLSGFRGFMTRAAITNTPFNTARTTYNFLQREGHEPEIEVFQNTNEPTGRIVINSPTDQKPRPVDPGGFDLQDITDLGDDLALGFGTLKVGNLIRQAGGGTLRQMVGESVASTVISSTTQAAGVARGTVDKFDPAGPVLTGVASLAGGGAVRIPAFAGARLGGVPTASVQDVARGVRNPFTDLFFKSRRGFRATFGKVPPEKGFFSDTQKVIAATKEFVDGFTRGRKKKEALLRASTKSGTRVDIKPLLDELQAARFDVLGRGESAIAARVSIADPATNVARGFNAEIDDMMASLIPFEGQGMSPDQLDRFIIRSLNPKVFKNAPPAAQSFAEELKSGIATGSQKTEGIRNTARRLLNESVEGVEDASLEAAEEIMLKKDAQAIFGIANLDLKTAKTKTIQRRLATIFEADNFALRQLLEAIEEKSGVDLLEPLQGLLAKTKFSRDDRKAVNALQRAFTIMTLGLPQILKFGSKVTTPLIPLGAPIGAAIESGSGPAQRVNRRVQEAFGLGKDAVAKSIPVVESAFRTAGTSARQLMDEALKKARQEEVNQLLGRQKVPVKVLDEEAMGAEEVGP